MEILHISPSDNLVGGATRVPMDLKYSLEKQGIHSSIFVGKKFSNFSDIEIIPKNLINKAVSYLLANDIDFFQSDVILSSVIYQNAALVHCHNLHGWYFKLDTLRKMSLEKPIVWTLHDMWAITPHCSHSFGCREEGGFFLCPGKDIYPSLLWHNEKYLIKRKKEIYDSTDMTIVVPSQWLKEKVEKSVLKNKDIRLIYNGVDTRVFKKYEKNQVRKELGLPVDKKLVLTSAFAGKKNKFKGWAYVEHAMKYFQGNDDIAFVCIGEGKNSKNIHYVPTTDNKDLMAKYYSAVDVLLFSSLAENFPLVILEAMSVGLPIVSFDVGGVKEVLQHKEHGYIAKYTDQEDLVEGLKYIFSLRLWELENMSAASQKLIREKFTLEIMAENYANLYKSLVKEV